MSVIIPIFLIGGGFILLGIGIILWDRKRRRDSNIRLASTWQKRKSVVDFPDKLSGRKSETIKEAGTKSFYEKDNKGTRHDILEMASTYWFTRISSPKKDPFVMYTFDNEKDAREALLELPCIHVAEDSKKLICSEVLIFGYYPTQQGKYEALVCGDDLTHELWQQAKESFTQHGGNRKNDLEPEKRAAPVAKAEAGKPGSVVFVREDRQQKVGQTMIYRVHMAPNAASAKAFLEQNPVARQFYYIVVETPEGNYCRDIQGIYKE
jgi:hypothetical protein